MHYLSFTISLNYIKTREQRMYSKRQSAKPLGIFTLVMINIIAIDSLRNLPTNAASGYSIISYYLIAAVLFLLPCALITAELAAKYPERGGVYVWVREAFGKPTAFFTIWLQWIYNVVWYPSILVFIATNIAYLIYPQLLSHSNFHIPKLFLITTIALLFLIATSVNSLGMLISGLVSNLSAIIGTLLPMAILIIIGVDFWHHHSSTIPTINHFLPFHGHKNHLALLSIVIFSLMGLEMSAVHAKEVKNPKRDYPLALISSGLIITITLILATLAIIVILPPNKINIISGMANAFHHFFQQAGYSDIFFYLIISMIIFGAFGGMSAWVIGPTKALLVAAEDGLLPKILSKTNRFQAPANILILQFILVMVLSCLFLQFKEITTPYLILSEITAVLALIFYICFFASAIKLSKNIKTNIAATIGIITCIIVIIMSFLPPDDIPTGNIYVYEGLLIGGSLLMVSIPLLIILINKIKRHQH